MTTQIQGSLNFHEKLGNVDEYLATHKEYEPYIRAADSLEGVRENIQDINRAIMMIHISPDIEPGVKQAEIDTLEEARNTLFKEGWKLRPGGEYNPDTVPISRNQVIDLIEKFGVDDSVAYQKRIQEDAPATSELLQMIQTDISDRGLRSIIKATAGNVPTGE
jgi:hypothetical protein